MDAEMFYDRIPVADLVISDVDVPDPRHLKRSQRYSGAEDVDPAAAIEAGMDPITRDPRSATGEAIRVIGYSPTTMRYYVVMIPDTHPPSGLWHVAAAWPANRSERDLHPGSLGGKEEQS